MNVGFEILNQFGRAVIQLLINPFLYVSALFLVMQYRKQIQLERKLFHSRLHSLRKEVLRSIIVGLVAGILISVVMAMLGIVITQGTVIVLWIITVLMAIVRVRFMCLAYSVGVLGILHVGLSWYPEAMQWEVIGTLFKWIHEAQMPGLIALVGVLHLAEGLLVSKQGAKMASPMFFEGKRGKLIGGYSLQSFWPITLFLIVPMTGGSHVELPWQALFSGDLWGAGWAILGFPIMMGYSELTLTSTPPEKVRRSGKLLMIYGVVIVMLAVGAYYWSPAILIAAVLSIGLHEGIMVYSRYVEARQVPLYVHDNRGLRILAVLPGSAAEEIGLQSGEIIRKINGMQVHSRIEWHEAMRMNAAFCKLEVLNIKGEIKFAQRAIYAGDHHTLGIILAPDQEAQYFVEMRQTNLFRYLRSKLSGRTIKAEQSEGQL
ncbi:PDZ domain-containing protein [Paenibacillus sp. N1-5-1-14]|uniref:PDZ domain-containing protein n=1 Tax=Paenibacillus radicibacter TaxID=2972488 RepID=UPI002158A3C5|nr:PDZ domain-containing protein [Paenibacillus radicibacter]MCR8645000.1 PDZ domain-containing protein [Paenibacillus radicibacter]